VTLIAIDGPGGSGKSTIARVVAARLGLARLDTGAMYRAVALGAARRGIDPADGAALSAYAEAMSLDVGDAVILDGEDVTTAIRAPEVDAVVSVVAAHPGVRACLVARQRAWAAARGGGVVEGRDIGSVVFPEADVKVYLTASAAERAARRAAERDAAGGDDLAATRAAIDQRDALDSTRETSPLVVAPGATVVDSTGRGIEEVAAEILALVGGEADAAEAASPAPPSAAPPATDATAGRPPATKGLRRAAELPPVRPPSRVELWFYAICRLIAVGSSYLLLPGRVVGAENLPASGAFIVAPVHRSYVDWLVVARITRRRLRYLVKGEVWKVRSVGRLLEAFGAFPVHRGSADRDALKRALEVLEAGEPLVVFPEGTRGHGPTVAPLRDGAAYLALRAGVPIVPVGLGGVERAMPRGARLPRPTRLVVYVAPPITSAVRAPGAARGRIARTATHELSEELRAGIESALAVAESMLTAGLGSSSGATPPTPPALST
jgi:cytidylate kinase